MRTFIVLLLVALCAVACTTALPDIGGDDGENLQTRIASRYRKAQDLITQLQTLLNNANKNMDILTKDLNQNDIDVDQHWLLFGIPVVLLIVVGYSFLEAGSVRSVNVVQAVMKNALIATLTAFVWWACGYAHAFGDNRRNGTVNGFIGNGRYFLASDKETPEAVEFGFWTYTWTYAVLASIISTQALAQRLRTPAYVFMTILFAGFVYPVVVHWCWSTSGWASPYVRDRSAFARSGVVDRAGSGVVHLTAGVAALAATLILRTRQGRYDKDYNRQFPHVFRAHNRVYQGIGVFFLWVSWYGQVSVSPDSKIHNRGAYFVSKTTINTTLSAAFAVLVTLLFDTFKDGRKVVVEGEKPEYRVNLSRLLNGVLVGLVAISAGCHVVEPWGAMFVGAISAFIYCLSVRLLHWARIDDQMETISIHAVGGLTGLWCVGWFARLDDVTSYYNWVLDERNGIWYGGNAGLWGVQAIVTLAIVSWTFGVTAVFYFVARYFNLVRVPFPVEVEGIDQNELTRYPETKKQSREWTNFWQQGYFKSPKSQKTH